MRSEHTKYDLEDSVDRIDQIISVGDNYEERETIPHLRDLTFTNGFYVKCSALCVDIRNLLEQSDFTENRLLTKIYRAYISEVTAVMNGNPKCAEVNIVRGSVLGVFDTPFQEDVDEVFSTAAKISSIVDIMNYKFKKNNLNEITIGIGFSYGKGFVMKAGYKGSSVYEVIWMGNIVDEASKLASYGNKESTDRESMVSEITYYNLNEDNRKILSFNSTRNCYHGDVVNSYINKWYKQHCP